MSMPYREAAVVLWGEAGGYVRDYYARIRAVLHPELPPQLPIVIGLTPYGACEGMTAATGSTDRGSACSPPRSGPAAGTSMT